MLTEYIQAAMREAQYELMENGEFFGSIPSCPGAWGAARTLAAARDELQETLEDWIVFRLRGGLPLPVIAGTDLNPGIVPDPDALPEPALQHA
ncbi:MAG: type II toxin-antitoxin system HicB family antitoxin [Limisphaerales bacterium]